MRVARMIVAVTAALLFPPTVAAWIITTLTDPPGSMEYAFGRLYTGAAAPASLAALVWSLVMIRRQAAPLRRRELVVVTLVLGTAGVYAGLLGVSSVRAHREEQRALAATAGLRPTFQSDLADAYWDWYRAEGGEEKIYVGNRREWWSFDPDGDGIPDPDAPPHRALEGAGWSERGVTVFDLDGDLVVDHLGWIDRSGDQSSPWCIPVVDAHDTYTIQWRRAVPGECAN